jgi:taurine dioxygenase
MDYAPLSGARDGQYDEYRESITGRYVADARAAKGRPVSHVRVRKRQGAGAEIMGITLADMSADDFRAVQAAFNEHGLLFFRNQSLNEREHIALAQRFGRINVNRFFAAHPDYPEIALVAKEPDQSINIGGAWHTDHSYDQEPALGSILVARELPPVGGDTAFASMYGAYDALSPGLQKTLESLRAVHSARHVFGKGGGYEQEGNDLKGRIGNSDRAEQLSDVIHPVVIRHPLSGKKALYVNPAFTVKFENWTEADSRELLDYLYGVATREENVCRFHWEPGSIALWDNRATWHFASNDYQGHRRIMHRITIEGCALSPVSA